MRVLIVDDCRAVRSVLQELLERTGHHCTVAESGPAAIRELERASSHDLVLLDFDLGPMDGRQTLTRLRELRPDLPVVCMSGAGDGSRFGPPHAAHAFLPKPFSVSELFRTIQRLHAADGRAAQPTRHRGPRDR